MARFQPSKKTTIITAATIAVALVAAIVVGIIIKGFSSKTRLSSPTATTDRQTHKYGDQPAVAKDDKAVNPSGAGSSPSTVQDTIEREKKAISESDKGGFVSAMAGAPVKDKKDLSPEDILKDTPPPQRSRGGYDPMKPQSVDKDGKLLSGQNHMPDPDKQGTREQMWAYLYSKKSNGGFIAKADEKGKPSEGKGTSSAQPGGPEAAQTTSGTTTGSASGGHAQLPVQVQYHKPYKAVVDRTFTSGAQNTTFVATLSDPPLRGWKVTGRATANYSELRFNVDVNSVISPENKPYSAKGFVASIDQSDGIVSAVKHEDVAGSMISGIAKGASAFLDAFRSDTTTIEVASGGVTVTGQNKVADRGKEASLAAGSAIFDDMSKKMTGSAKKNPTIIVERGVPVLVYFVP